MLKVFISQPMRDKTPADIKTTRAKAVATVHELFHNEPSIEIIDTYFPDAGNVVKPLWYLGESIKRLAEADIAYFCKGWDQYRGCRLEHTCAYEYGINIIEEAE